MMQHHVNANYFGRRTPLPRHSPNNQTTKQLTLAGTKSTAGAMFKKKPTVKLLASLRSTDRRKLANQLVETFSPTPSSNDTDVTLRNRILPPNARSAKLSTTSGPDLKPVSGTLYVGGEPPSQPLWVQIGDEGPFPTVYTLWRNAGLLPILLTHDDVLARMRDGADLMVPGLIGPPFPDGAKAGRLVGIASEHNPSVPLVVGVCEVDVCDIVGVAGGHGRAVRGVHWVGDEIFKMGDGEVPDVVVAEQEVVEAEAEAGDGDGGGVALNDAGAALDEDEEREKKDDFRELSTRGLKNPFDWIYLVTCLTSSLEIDETFHSAAIFGIHDFHSTGKFSSLALPLTSSQFISTLVLPYLPPASSFAPHNLLQNTVPHPSLQLKKSSHKSAAKFLKSLDKELLVKIKNRNGGEVIVLDVNWESDVVAAFEPYPLPEAPKEKKGPASEGPQGSSGILKVVELFRPNGKAVAIFQAAGAAYSPPYPYHTRYELLD